MVTKSKMIEKINEAVGNDQNFGNDIADIADTWRDEISRKLSKMGKKELEKLYNKAIIIVPNEEETEEDKNG